MTNAVNLLLLIAGMWVAIASAVFLILGVAVVYFELEQRRMKRHLMRRVQR